MSPPSKYATRSQRERWWQQIKLEAMQALEDVKPWSLAPLLDQQLQYTFETVKFQWQDLDGLNWATGRERNGCMTQQSGDSRYDNWGNSVNNSKGSSSSMSIQHREQGRTLCRTTSYAHIDLHDPGRNVPDLPEKLLSTEPPEHRVSPTPRPSTPKGEEQHVDSATTYSDIDDIIDVVLNLIDCNPELEDVSDENIVELVKRIAVQMEEENR
ncbi:hypothetical protein E1B28_006659 [Marasmius oreades]|uniref:Uncharacterized protein n=1 Tax=Marasmius oreades TaxID=181124 RepID=A0A9P7UWJ9_9AGAR|nr:uncharacterized protein E1B28_006659 [Marasmius oreades]KAG7095976.1 hypothetical protein E1B28_006659 [Marasmius oreades]